MLIFKIFQLNSSGSQVAFEDHTSGDFCFRGTEFSRKSPITCWQSLWLAVGQQCVQLFQWNKPTRWQMKCFGLRSAVRRVYSFFCTSGIVHFCRFLPKMTMDDWPSSACPLMHLLLCLETITVHELCLLRCLCWTHDILILRERLQAAVQPAFGLAGDLCLICIHLLHVFQPAMTPETPNVWLKFSNTGQL